VASPETEDRRRPSPERRDHSTRALCGAVAAWFGVHPSALAPLDKGTVTMMARRLKAGGSAAEPAGAPATCVEIGLFRLDWGARAVHVEGRLVDLTAKEFDLLGVLVSPPGLVRTRTALIEQVWGPGIREESSTLYVYIRRLRQKLGDLERLPFRITTVRGRGYRVDLVGGCATGAGAVAGRPASGERGQLLDSCLRRPRRGGRVPGPER
jgi:Transcriptional regulatory protein, C terminal